MSKRILITGAGSGFGEGTAIGLARKQHQVIAAVHDWPQATRLRNKVSELGLEKNLRVEKLDLLHKYDVQNALKWDIDILVNNAGMGENGPIAEIPVELVRRVFDTNAMVDIIPDEHSKFRNVVPEDVEKLCREYQESRWDLRI